MKFKMNIQQTVKFLKQNFPVQHVKSIKKVDGTSGFISIVLNKYVSPMKLKELDTFTSELLSAASILDEFGIPYFQLDGFHVQFDFEIFEDDDIRMALINFYKTIMLKEEIDASERMVEHYNVPVKEYLAIKFKMNVMVDQKLYDRIVLLNI